MILRGRLNGSEGGGGLRGRLGNWGVGGGEGENEAWFVQGSYRSWKPGQVMEF